MKPSAPPAKHAAEASNNLPTCAISTAPPSAHSNATISTTLASAKSSAY
ncbi:hypothetical protein [Thiothrix subterranea]|nr:hypothetical protein [Thiothrix subterranea]